MSNLQPPYAVQEVSDVEIAFPAHVARLMPEYGSVSSERTWLDFQADWFFSGLDAAKFFPKEGIDPEKALRHLKAIQGSFEPKHEHKEEAVAFLAGLWFDAVITKTKTYGEVGS